MVHAFIMVKTGAGESERLVEAIRGLDNVSEAHIVAGAFDIITEVDATEVYDILQATTRGIQSFSGVDDTRTYISLDD